ncbi:DUF2969 domain-containing protein [Bombilactobacillus folatiphilus]|uniref:DUF2969 domain-containing protein n=1 Tax=Bombilactobacillus folatiphilus TaxID=2923362 RepID=A0ABY4PAW5_9LACO|nr:DUF2969 family protein [Bombilactobacillus folatiphilus]UQS82681.1 DUF2969 domain-containing protein [Bombilactobacillus folatiphilus]
MRTKERKFNVNLLEISATSWKVVIDKKNHEQTIARIEQVDQKHFEVNLIDDTNATKLVATNLNEAVNSALMQYNLHLN